MLVVGVLTIIIGVLFFIACMLGNYIEINNGFIIFLITLCNFLSPLFLMAGMIILIINFWY